jgi:hypothetical protein
VDLIKKKPKSGWAWAHHLMQNRCEREKEDGLKSSMRKTNGIVRLVPNKVIQSTTSSRQLLTRMPLGKKQGQGGKEKIFHAQAPPDERGKLQAFLSN